MLRPCCQNWGAYQLGGLERTTRPFRALRLNTGGTDEQTYDPDGEYNFYAQRVGGWAVSALSASSRAYADEPGAQFAYTARGPLECAANPRRVWTGQ
jgi:hypothetical protein